MSQPDPTPGHTPQGAAERLRGRIAAAATEAERARRLPDDLVEALGAAGLFRLCVPRALGGDEAHVATLVRAIEALAAADGSTGWVAMIGATSGLVAAYLPLEAAREIWTRPDTLVTGVFAPRGRALPAEGGYRATGRWAFASGCEHADWLLGGCVVLENGAPRRRPSGTPESRMLLLPADEYIIHDTWHTSGMCATGSHDIELEDRFVPAERGVDLLGPPRADGTLYRFPVFGLLAVGVCSVALGVARAAIDALVALAAEKVPTFAARRLAERPATQLAVARAEAELCAARAFLLEQVEASWEWARNGPLDAPSRARLRIAAAHVAERCAVAVTRMYEAGGGSSIYASSPLQRHFRDAHVVTQHASVAGAQLEVAGRVLLGVDTDTSLL